MTGNALVAIALGSVLAIILLIPTAAVQYRLDGRLGPVDLLVLVTSAIYVLALWTYTLLPLPDPGHYQCQGTRLDPFASIGLIHWPQHGGVLRLLREPPFLQVVLNVLLFVPLGYYLRVILKRGVVVATVVGFAVSLLIETTQRTGDWGLYDCAYRLFDVDDLIVNTLGATIGSLLSIHLVRRRRAEIVLPTTISFGRRLVSLVCDLLFVVLLGAGIALVFRASHHEVPPWLQLGVPLALQALCVLGLGRTIGELTVSLHTQPRRPRLEPLSRVVKLVLGVGSLALYAVPAVGPLLLAAWLAVTLVAAYPTREHRGLANAAAGLDLRIGDEETAASTLEGP
jgi:glycopeptide antibiotics resistance protein